MRSKFMLLAVLALHSSLSMAQVYGDYITLRGDVVDMLDFRAKAFVEYEKLSEKTKKDVPLTGGELNSIHEAVIDREFLSERVIKFINENLPKVKKHIKAYDASFMQETESDDPTTIQWTIDDGNTIAETDKRELLRTIGMGLTLADNYLQTIYFYQQDSTLRRIINEGDSIPNKPGNQLKNHIKELLNRKSIKAFSGALYLYSALKSEIADKAKTDEEFKFWTKVIDNSYMLEQLKAKKIELGNSDLEQQDIFHAMKKVFKNKRRKSDFVHKAGYKIMHVLSKAFGNSAGSVQFRKGMLLGRESVITELKTTLKPLDILLEKTPFRLTDRFIPGYFGHNAIWLGTEQELKDLGLWDHPVFKPLQSRIREGKSIVEALRPGVTTNPLEHFLDIDDMAVMRIKQITTEELKKNLIVAASQYGKTYDFNFDVATQDVLVCSELIFMSFLDISWRTEKIAGRWTINPDAVAERGRPDHEFNTIILYTGGEKVVGKLNEKMAYTLANSDMKDEELLKGFKKIDQDQPEKVNFLKRAIKKIKTIGE